MVCRLMAFVAVLFCANQVFGWEVLQSVAIKNPTLRAGQVQLQNDSMPDAGGQGFLQQGFITGEKAGVWLKVPTTFTKFKVDYFRVLLTGMREKTRAQVAFQMDISNQPGHGIAGQIENFAEVTPGPYWNDIPAIGAIRYNLPCALPGEYVGAALEFTHSGLPSVMRDFDGPSNPAHNMLFGIPGDWKMAIQYEVNGDWILRVVGHEATAGECN